MLKKNFKRSLLALGLLGGLCFSAEAGYLLPTDAIVMAHAPNLERDSAQYAKMPFNRFYNSDSMRPLVAPFESWLKENLEKAQEEAKIEGKLELSDFFYGELLFSIQQLEVDMNPELLKTNPQEALKHFSMFAISETNPKAQKSVRSVLDAILRSSEKDEALVRKDLSIEGKKIHKFSSKINPDLLKIMPPQAKMLSSASLYIGLIDNHLFLGMGVAEDMERQLELQIGALKKKSLPEQKYMNRMLVNPESLYTLARSAALMAQKELDKLKDEDPAELSPQQQMMMMIDIPSLLENSGLLDITHIDIKSTLEKNGLRSESDLGLHQPMRGLLRFFVESTSQGLGPVPDWVDKDVLAYKAYRLPFSNWLKEAQSFMDLNVPAFAPMLNMQLAMRKQVTGLDLQKDLLDLIDDTIYQVSYPVDMTASEEPASSDVFLLKLKNGPSFEKNLLRFIANPSLKLVPAEYMGANIYTLSPAAHISFMEGYLILGSETLVKRTIVLIKNPGKGKLKSDKRFQAVLDKVPAGAKGLQLMNIDAFVRWGLDQIHQPSPLSMGIGQLFNNLPFKVSVSDIPSSDKVKENFGRMIDYTTLNEKGLHSESFYSYE